MLTRDPISDARRVRARLNSRRYRLRRRRHQRVYRCTADERLVDMLCRRGYLRADVVVHSSTEIELALTLWVADEASK